MSCTFMWRSLDLSFKITVKWQLFATLNRFEATDAIASSHDIYALFSDLKPLCSELWEWSLN